MKRLIQKLKEIWSIKELRERLLFTLALIAIYRLGSFIILPDINPDILEQKMNNSGNLLGLLSAFTGGAFSKASIMALGIMPYITASIIVQLLGFAVPYFQKLQKEGESGQRKSNQITRMLTILITAVQASAYLTYLYQLEAVSGQISASMFWLSSVTILTAGTVFCMWLGERITDKGIGNGVSLLIMIGIVADLPSALQGEIGYRLSSAGGLIIFLLELAFLVLVTIAAVALVQAVRKIPLQFARSMASRESNIMPAQGARDYLPIKLNASGVMPIIFAQALMFIPAAIVGYASSSSAQTGLFGSLMDNTSTVYNLVFFLLIIIFTYVYTALIVNPQQQAEFLKRQNAFVPGVKPGDDTAEFIDVVTTRITLPGAIALGIIAILPSLAAMVGITGPFSQFYGGTSLLIMVGVILDTLAVIENYLYMKHYDGLTQGSRIRGRTGQDAIGASM